MSDEATKVLRKLVAARREYASLPSGRSFADDIAALHRLDRAFAAAESYLAQAPAPLPADAVTYGQCPFCRRVLTAGHNCSASDVEVDPANAAAPARDNKSREPCSGDGREGGAGSSPDTVQTAPHHSPARDALVAKISEAFALMDSMIRCGEDHSPVSLATLQAAREAAAALAQRDGCRVEQHRDGAHFDEYGEWKDKP